VFFNTIGRSALFGLAVACISVQAETSNESSIQASDPMVVTANRSETPASGSLSAISVIDRAAIERSQAPDLLELLRMEAGIDISRAGGPGGQTSVFLRGTNSNHTLVLIDGVRVAAAGTGAFTWESLDPALIERIEIVRGPRAARWGSDAIGGVIQIFTRQPDGFSASIAAGSYGDRSLSVAAGNERFSLTASRRSVDGFSTQNPEGFAFDPDDDGFDQTSAALRASVPVSNGILDVHARANRSDIEFDQGESDLLNASGGLGYRIETLGGWTLSAQLMSLRDELESRTAFGDSELITRRLQTGVQAERRLASGLRWMLGVDAWDESGESRGDWDDDRRNLGAWTGIDGRLDQIDFEASLRIDDDSEFGSEVTGDLAAGWNVNDDWRIHAAFGRGFRSPTFNQLFSPGFGGSFAGNPDLGPETSTSIEGSVQWRGHPDHRLDLNVFLTRIDDLIDFAGIDFQAINIRRAEIEGAELAHAYRNGRWIIQSQLTLQKAEDRDSGRDLLRRANLKASSRVDYLWASDSWLGVELVHVGERRDVGQTELASYTLLNVSAGIELTDQWRLEGRIDNLNDRDYEPLIGFNAPRRSLRVALTWLP
jgi:vitamin B12 transporter